MRVTIESQVQKDFLISPEMVQLFAELTGDKNPIHLDQDYAANTPFKRCIAHGILGLSFISNCIATYLPGPGSIYLSQSASFVNPIYVGDTITVSLKVLSLKEGKPIAKILTEVFVRNTLAITGEAMVKFKMNNDNK